MPLAPSRQTVRPVEVQMPVYWHGEIRLSANGRLWDSAKSDGRATRSSRWFTTSVAPAWLGDMYQEGFLS